MNKNLLRLLSLLLALMMLVTAVGCDFPSGHESEPESESEVSEESKPCTEHDYELIDSMASSCTASGYELYRCSVCGKENKVDLPKSEHVYTPAEGTEEDYITPVVCEVCGSSFRRPSERIYDADFVYDLTDERIEEIKGVFQTLMDYVEAADRYDASAHKFVKDSDQYKKNKDFEHTYFDPFDDEVEYAVEQYQFSYVAYCVHDGDEAYKADYDKASDFYNEIIEMYYKVFRPIYETEYRDYFFSEEDGWDEESIQNVLHQSDLYSDPHLTELRKRIDDIQIEFRDIEDPASGRSVPALFEEFVGLQNELAQMFGFDNYMDYAYQEVYERDYTVEDVHKMRAFVKKYLGDGLILDYYNYKRSQRSSYSTVYGADSKKSIFKDNTSLGVVADYFDTLESDKYKNAVDFKAQFNKLLKEGNYYTGDYDGAFSYYLSTRDNTILYFGPTNYSSAFTFVHEFGHYFNNVYNHGINISMDHDETQSQGNEMLFLAYLKERLTANGEPAQFSGLEAAELLNSLQTILLATAVDEFEELIYSGYYDGDNPQIKTIVESGSITRSDYDRLFMLISEDYGLNDLYNPIYWRYVCIEAPGYYISYAMSLIPSISVYAKYCESGYEAAKEAYLKLFTFSDNAKMAHIDVAGDMICDVDYADILKYCGLMSAFEEKTYKSLYEIYKVCRNQ